MLDWINGGFELIGGFLCWFNVKKLLKDKRIDGVYWPVTAFFTLWGNLESLLLPIPRSVCFFHWWHLSGFR